MRDYEKMLEDVYSKLPEKEKKKERFEIPKLEVMIHGKQTIIRNLNEVAGKLNRDPAHLLKYFSKELAVPSVFDGKRGILQGRFREDVLNKKLEDYVKEFVLCNECGKPDTVFIIFEGVKYKRCEVCGARSPVRTI